MGYKLRKFRANEMIKMFRTSQRQLQYWGTTGLLDSNGKDKQPREYTMVDVAVMLVVTSLRKKMPIQRLRPLIKEVMAGIKKMSSFSSIRKMKLIMFNETDFVLTTGNFCYSDAMRNSEDAKVIFFSDIDMKIDWMDKNAIHLANKKDPNAKRA